MASPRIAKDGSDNLVIKNGGIMPENSVDKDFGSDTKRWRNINLSGDIVNYEAVNDGNPQFRIGSDDANEGHIQAVYDSGAQTLDYLLISTDSAGEGDIVLSPAGNVGIGVTDPDELLEVAGNIKIDKGASFSELEIWRDSIQYAGIGSGGNQFKITAYNNKDIYIVDDSGNGIVIKDGGNVGIGEPSPSQALDLIGALELEDTTTSTKGVIYKGSDRFIHNFHHPTGGGAVPLGQNTFVGENAGNLTMGSTATLSIQASFNTGIGRDALSSDTTGYYNTAVGAYALYLNTSGYHNAGVGLNAGKAITGGGNNATSNTSVYLGSETKAYADGDTNEIVIGYYATGIGSNTVVLGNDSIGTTALKGDVGIGITSPDGLLHTAISNAANNIYFDTYDDGGGKSVLYLRKSDSDTIGTKVETANGKILGQIVFQGVDTGSNFEEGVEIKAVQDGAAGAYVPTNLVLSTFSSTAQNNNQLVLHNDGNVGIGTDAPQTDLNVASNTEAILRITSDLDNNSADTDVALQMYIDGITGVGALKTQLRYNQGADIVGLGYGGDDIAIDSSGNVGINISSPLAKLHIDQSVADAAIPVLTLDQADVSDGFINFIGSDRGIITGATDSLKSVRVELGGVVYRLALYVDA